MSITENICPVCKKGNELEAIVCRYCGVLLENPSLDSGTQTKTTNIQVSIPEGAKDWSVDETAAPDDGIAVYMEGEYQPVHVNSSGEFVIGRKSGTTAKVQEGLFDLSPLGGYARGVSRRHVVIHRTKQGYEVLDLGSVNGTWLDDKRMVPHKPYPLASGSHLRLGSMRLIVLYRSPAENEQES